MRVGKRHMVGPLSHVSIASLIERILAGTMEIWNHECGPIWPNFAVFAIVCHIGTTISPWGTRSSSEGGQLLWQMTKGRSPLSVVLAPPAHPEFFNFWCDPSSPPLHRMLLSAPSVWSSPR